MTQFVLTGFDQTAGIRLYAFQGVGEGRRVNYTVKVNLALIPNYGIRIQELPLLCRELLQNQVEPNEASALTFSEQEMRSLAEKRAAERAESAQKKKPGRYSASANPGAAWRAPLA
jgi:hypothetical protein